MAQTTAIEWCDATANLWWGCQHVHAGCDHCYAEDFAKTKGKHWSARYEVPGVWKLLAKLQRLAASEGHRRTVFVGSMMDIFERPQSLSTWQGGLTPISTGELRQRFFRDVIPACPDLTFLCLTKRPSNIVSYVPWEWLEGDGWPANVWTGASVVDQPTLDTLGPQLMRVPGRHFFSYEPALGPIDFSAFLPSGLGHCSGCADGDSAGLGTHSLNTIEHPGPAVGWVIGGGESGPHARPAHPDWFRSVRDQCAVAAVPFLFKQWGEYAPWVRQSNREVSPIDLIWIDQAGTRFGLEQSDCVAIQRVGKKHTGRLLDGREHLEFPEFQSCTEVA